MESALDSEMFSYFTQLNDAEKKSVIQMLQTFLKRRTGHVDAISIEEYNQELREAEEEYKKGEYLPHEELLKEIEKWKAGNMR